MRSAVVGTAQVKAAVDRYGRQAIFATALALTESARDAQRTVTSDLPEIFDSPNPFTQRALAVLPARKDDLVATVLVKDQQAEYLGIQETGGARTPKPGAPVFVPKNIRTDRYGNVPARFWRQLDQMLATKAYVGAQTYSIASRKQVSRHGGGVFVASGRNPRTRHLPPGIYERPKVRKATKGRRKGAVTNAQQPLKLLIAFDEQASYKPRFRFQERVAQVVRATFERNFRRALVRALATAR
ncbi:hypothetical protein [Oceanibaculum nanhaiense]|uniref:hypothetical protein n=1 Tax=Oceanibaculum nanhaiense TaxID=1909734 RepID=UPI003D277017